MGVTAGEILGVKQPGDGETVRFPIMLIDNDGVAVTGEAWDAAGMTVTYTKEDESGRTAFPTFGTENWVEIGDGEYRVVFRGDDAAEKAVLDTGGFFSLYVKTDNTRGDPFLFKVNPADVARSGEEMDVTAAAKQGHSLTAAERVAINAKLEEEHDAGPWTAGVGSGVNTVTPTLKDAANKAVAGVICKVRNETEDEPGLAWGETDQNGQCQFQLNDATYKLRYGPSAFYSFADQPYTLVVSGNTEQTFNCEALTIPASPDPLLCACWLDIRYAAGAKAGQLVGAGEGTVEIKAVSPRWVAEVGEAILGRQEGESFLTNGNGRVQFEAVRGVKLTVNVLRPGATNVKTFRVPEQATYCISR